MIPAGPPPQAADQSVPRRTRRGGLHQSTERLPFPRLLLSTSVQARRRISYRELRTLWAAPARVPIAWAALGPEQRECQKRMSGRMPDRMSEYAK